MKQLIIMAVSLLTITASGFTTAAKANNKNSKLLISNKPAYHSIVVNDDIDVVLTEAPDMQIYATGEKEDLTAINYFVKRGVLYVESKSGSLKNKVTVHISVSNLKQIDINGNSSVTSNGVLSSSRLKVVVNGEAKFNLKSYGEILFEADEDIDLHFKSSITGNEKISVKIDSSLLKEADQEMDKYFSRLNA